MRLATLILTAAVVLCGASVLLSHAHTLPTGAVLVDHVPPDACVAFFGPGPCREHGSTVLGSTDAVAGTPPSSWRGAVR